MVSAGKRPADPTIPEGGTRADKAFSAIVMLVFVGIAIALLVSACVSGSGQVTGKANAAEPVYWHDDAHHVSCWIGWNAISCLPDR